MIVNRKFKIGDRVVYLNPFGNTLNNNDFGTVTRLPMVGWMSIKYDYEEREMDSNVEYIVYEKEWDNIDKILLGALYGEEG